MLPTRSFLKSAVAFAAVLGLVFTAPSFAAATDAPATPRNIIFLIGDGMGLAHVSGTMAVADAPLALEGAQVIGLSKTSSASAYVTDSAAGGTALSSGQKTRNGTIGMDSAGKAIPSLFAHAAAAGKSTGLVVTCAVTHATPAAFVAHNKSRKNETEIAEDFLRARPNVFIGGGRKFFEQREDGKNLTDGLRSGGYTVAYTLEEVLTAPASQRLAGLLADAALPKISEGRGDMLPRATQKALDILGANPEGFVLMVEGSQIDWGGHQNDWDYVLGETLDFDAAVRVAFAYADAHPGTLVVVTADHETGGLSLIGGDLKGRTVKTAWGTKKHTGIMVPVYAYGTGAERFGGIYENTAIFHRMMALLGLAEKPQP